MIFSFLKNWIDRILPLRKADVRESGRRRPGAGGGVRRKGKAESAPREAGPFKSCGLRIRFVLPGRLGLLNSHPQRQDQAVVQAPARHPEGPLDVVANSNSKA